MRLSSLLGVVALTTSMALAQTITVPAIFATTEGGTTGNVWIGGTNRVQCLYDSSNFLTQGVPAPVQITNVEFRLAGGLTTNIVNYPNCEIYLQNAATDYLSPSTVFANNRTVAFPTLPNFAGPVDTVAVGATTPNDYFINIPLTVPFDYDPSIGADLLMEIVIYTNPSPLTGNTISAGYSAAAHACNSVRSVFSTTATSGSFSAFAPVTRFTYQPIVGAGFNTVVGAGCGAQPVSFYELFPGSSNDLSGQTVSMTKNTNGGYDVTTQAGGAVVPPTNTGLALGDDQVSLAITLPFVFNFPGGSTQTIFVDSNGSVLLGVSGASNIGGSAAAFLSATQRISPAMMDLEPDGATNVANVFAQVNPSNPSEYLITWNGVHNFGATAPMTFQVALIDNGTDDRVEMRYQTLVNDSTSNLGICITGFTRGNGAVDGGSSDLTAGTISTVSESKPLGLGVTNHPATGFDWNLHARELPATSTVGLEIFGVSDPGVNDLAIIGMPGCGLRASLDAINVFLPTGPTHDYSLSIPVVPSLVGISIFSAAATFTDPPLNAFGLITSNGMQGTIGNN